MLLRWIEIIMAMGASLMATYVLFEWIVPA